MRSLFAFLFFVVCFGLFLATGNAAWLADE